MLSVSGPRLTEVSSANQVLLRDASLQALRCGEQRRREDEQIRHDVTKYRRRGVDKDDRTDEAARRSDEEERPQRARLTFEVGTLRGRAGDVAGSQRDEVRDVRPHGWQTEPDEDGKTDQRPAAGERVHPAGGNARQSGEHVRPRAESHRRVASDRRAQSVRRISASPCPPPPHSAAAPVPPPRRRSS